MRLYNCVNIMPQYLLDWRVAAFNKLRLGSHNKQLVTPYPCIRWSVHAGRCPPPHVQDGHGGVAPYLSFRPDAPFLCACFGLSRRSFGEGRVFFRGLLWLGAPATRSGGSLSRAFSTLPASSLFRKAAGGGGVRGASSRTQINWFKGF